MKLLSCLRRLTAATGGASAVEFALVMTFMGLPLTIGAYDFGTALYAWMQVGAEARAGAQYVGQKQSPHSCTVSPSNDGCSNSGFTSAIQAATGLGSKITVTVGAPYCGCQNGSTFTSQSCTGFSASSSSTFCATGTPVELAQITATYTYAPVFSYLGIGPSNGFNIAASSTALLF